MVTWTYADGVADIILHRAEYHRADVASCHPRADGDFGDGRCSISRARDHYEFFRADGKTIVAVPAPCPSVRLPGEWRYAVQLLVPFRDPTRQQLFDGDNIADDVR